MILTGLYDSPFVRRVAITLHHYDLPFERRQLSTFGDFETVRVINPLGKVPALTLNDGEVLFDSAAIIDALDEMAGPGSSLTPSGGPQRRTVLRTIAVALGLSEKVMELRGETLRRPEDKQVPDLVARLERQIASALEWLEDMAPPTDSRGWMHGDRFTQADVTVAVAVTNIARKMADPGDDPTWWPRLRALTARCESLPAFQAAPFGD